MTARERYPDAYQAGYMQAQLEGLGVSPFTDDDAHLADVIALAEQVGDTRASDRLSAQVAGPQPPRHLTPEQQSDWWLAFYAGRRDARLADERG